MYDEPYQEIGPLFDSNFLNINKTDLLHFIHVLVYESREWDNHYYNECGKKVTSCLCPCSKVMKEWRTKHNLQTYLMGDFPVVFGCKARFKNPKAFEDHVSKRQLEGCIYHYAIHEIIYAFRHEQK